MGNANGGNRRAPSNSGFGVPSSWNSIPTTLGMRGKQAVKLPSANMHICDNGKAGFSLSALYQLEGRPLGVGGFGQVFVGRHTHQEKDDIHRYAIKIIPKCKMSYHGLPQRKRVKNCRDLEHFCSEVQILKRLRANGEPPVMLPVLYLYEVFVTSTSIHLVTDLLVEDLGKWRNDLQQCTEKMAIDVCRIVLDAIDFMHDHHVVHRDLKMSNIMFQEKDHINTLKIIDFGLARVLHHNDTVMLESESGRPTRDFFCGTPGYIPPVHLSRFVLCIAIESVKRKLTRKRLR